MLSLRNFDIKYIKGVGPRRAELLASELGIRSAYDLLRHYPTAYVDRSKTYTLRSLADIAGDNAPQLQVRGRFVSFNVLGEGARMRLVGLFTDGTATLEVVWFKNIKGIRKSVVAGQTYVLFGKPTRFMSTIQMAHPEVDVPDAVNATAGLHGVYPLTEKLRQRGISGRVIYSAVVALLETRRTPLAETLPPSVIEKLGLMSLDEAIRTIHMPTDPRQLDRARHRLKFEELFYIQTDILRRSRKRKNELQGYYMPHVGRWFNDFYHQCLPFQLTGAQKRVIKEIRADIMGGRQMNRLVQGDVGSGKTLVALLSMLLAVDNGYQACLMAPTEILAAQHYETISGLTAAIGLNVKLLTGSTRTAARRKIAEELTDGSLHILIGTHAVIEDNVEFARLGFVVIDEQHRFGVAQRARLWKKNVVPPHVLVMTATPIPRTLAMTVYGDLDVSVIDELPPGRKPVTTLLRYDDNRLDVYRGITRQLRQGRQIYIVYPLIKESEKSDLKSLEEGYETICENFRHWKVAYVHGKMKPAEKDAQMELFASGKADILVATTVIEVGVNVPNATTMVIENAERFGLSQLHQLRGRVGRGAAQSYCILMSKRAIAKETRKRLEIMTSTTDGFLVAEADLKMRGPGDLEGTLQSGMAIDLKISNLATDGRIIQLARDEAEYVLRDDATLSNPDHARLRTEMQRLFAKTIDWSMIS